MVTNIFPTNIMQLTFDGLFSLFSQSTFSYVTTRQRIFERPSEYGENRAENTRLGALLLCFVGGNSRIHKINRKTDRASCKLKFKRITPWYVIIFRFVFKRQKKKKSSTKTDLKFFS